ncbi:HNH endonuclease [Billgrantia endophytica]|uniref:HNH endonuclease n=1 Tax=Billgrantia endophytica TaxID=2033802 RepID=A0A2N7TV60_9GAMM|nr:HNH endonuclease [Halomonas endophytica]PMR72082.1 HNH endonuclease [Halomonas endophytica]
MKLTVDFSALFSAARRMGYPIEDDFVLDTPREPWEDRLESEGIEIDDINEIDVVDNLLSYRGRQILLYIKDHGYRVENALEDGSTGNKYHVSECRKLREMRSQGRFERYVVTQNINGEFDITGYRHHSRNYTEGKTRLDVCKLCLGQINYKGYKSHRNFNAFVKFNLDEFFQTYSSFFTHLPQRKMGEGEGYTVDWPEVSRAFRQEKGYTCEKCVVRLSDHPRLLHVHHINGVKSDNRKANLKALCADCHSKEAFHESMYVSHSDRQTISRRRHEQQFRNPDNWQEVIELADSGLRGFIERCHSRRLPVPEVGLDLQDDREEVKGMLELAWPRQRLGIAINERDRLHAERLGWKVFSVHEALDNFTTFVTRL